MGAYMQFWANPRNMFGMFFHGLSNRLLGWLMASYCRWLVGQFRETREDNTTKTQLESNKNPWQTENSLSSSKKLSGTNMNRILGQFVCQSSIFFGKNSGARFASQIGSWNPKDRGENKKTFELPPPSLKGRQFFPMFSQTVGFIWALDPLTWGPIFLLAMGPMPMPKPGLMFGIIYPPWNQQPSHLKMDGWKDEISNFEFRPIFKVWMSCGD